MDLLIGIVAFVFMLSFIVTIHEFGHFIVARHFGVFCKEFSIGMGPALYQRQGKETMFSIRAFPLGGYVMMAGEQDGSQDEQDDWLKDVPAEKRLNNKTWWQQFLVMMAGIAMNVALAWIIFVGIALASGKVAQEPKPIIYEVVEGSGIEQAGLQKGDEIIKVSDGKESVKPKTHTELLEYVQYHHDTLTLTIQRDKETFDVQVEPMYDEENQIYYLGFRSLATYRQCSPWESVQIGTQNFLYAGSAIFRSLAMLVKGQGLENISGPVGIFQVTSKTAQMGLASYLSLCGLISLNIGIFNALPIPALDGGRVLMMALEKLLGKKMSSEMMERIIMTSFFVLIALLLFATYNDILRLF